MIAKAEKATFFLIVLVLLSGSLIAPAAGNDWPQFRGPGGQGIAENANPPTQWSTTKNVSWKTNIQGQGWSSPIIYDGSVYLTTSLLDKEKNPTSLRVVRVDAKTGAIAWDREVISHSGPSAKQAKNSYASSTPSAENGKIYAHFGHMGTACVDVNGKVIWRQTGVVYPPEHGNGSSPILAADKLIFTCDGSVDPFLAALDKQTGDVAWKTHRTENKAKRKYSFCTPLLIDQGGRKIVVSPYSGAVAAYDPADGKEIWRVLYGQGFSVTPRPVYADGMVFISSGFSQTHVHAIRLGGHGDVTDTHVAWKSASDPPHVPSLLLVGKKLYYISDKGVVSCLDAASGKQYWQGSIRAPVSASPVFAGGRIYITSEKGKTFVIKAGEKFEILAENDLGERTFASPAVSGKTLFIRTKATLYCIEER